MLSNKTRLFISSLLIAGLLGCTAQDVHSPVQKWHNLDVYIETRPPEITAGMVEFLVFANRDQRRPATNLVVSLSVSDSGRWTQAMQDGHVGVYRRALRVTDPKSDVLFVRLKQGDVEGELRFPLDFAIH